MHPNHADFKEEWKSGENELIFILKRDLTKEQANNIFSDDSNSNQKMSQLLCGLNAVLFSATVKLENKKVQKYRATMQDSFKSFFLICPTENSMESKISEWRNTANNSGFKIQVIIVAFGTNTFDISDKFVVILENLKYIFIGEESLIAAIECALKMYFVFNIEFPILSANVHEFMSQKFFGLGNQPLKKSKLSTKVASLMNSFK